MLEIRNQYTFPQFPGRMESMELGTSKITFVGAHNMDGFRKIFNSKEIQTHKFDIIISAFSKRFNQEERSMIKILTLYQKENKKTEIYLSEFDHFKALKFDSDLCSMFVHNDDCSISLLRDWKTFLLNLKVKSKRVLVTGSYYFIGEVQKFFKNIF